MTTEQDKGSTDSGDKLKTWGAIAGILGALVSAYVSLSTAQTKEELTRKQLALQQNQQIQDNLIKQQQASINDLTAKRQVKKLDEDMEFRVYEAVRESLKAKDLTEQEAASALVTVLLDEPLRTGLLTVINRSPTTKPEVKAAVGKVLSEERTFQQEDEEVKNAIRPLTPESTASPSTGAASSVATASRWSNWDIDVFWCEHSGAAAERDANSIVAALKTDGAQGRLRARKLPDTVNARPGYSVDGYEIRKDPGEEPIATALQTLAQGKVAGSKFVLVQSGQATHWYVSAFLCPASAF